MSTSHHRQRSLSEPHSYNIQAKLQHGILSIYVHDTMTHSKWRQEFNQVSFPGHKLYDVAKCLINAIQEMISTQTSVSNHKPIAILVYNSWCYLTVHGSHLPSFALRPIQPPSNAPTYPLPPSKVQQINKNIDQQLLSLSSATNQQHDKPKNQRIVKKEPTRPPPPRPTNNTPTRLLKPTKPTYVDLPTPPLPSRYTKVTFDVLNSDDLSDDGIAVNTDDEDSSSLFNYNHSNSADEDGASLDSLFTHDGGQIMDGIVHKLSGLGSKKSPKPKQLLTERTEAEQSMSGSFDFEYSGQDAYDAEEYDDEYEDSSREDHDKLKICVNGDPIKDVVTHVIEQQIAEEEYYEEEEMEDELYYDPNFLGVNPYDD